MADALTEVSALGLDANVRSWRITVATTNGAGESEMIRVEVDAAGRR